MEINGKVFCLFEQSGTFKGEFQKLGYDAKDYDIQNEFGQTDNICDLFAEIERAYNGETSLFDSISAEDLILAFSLALTLQKITNSPRPTNTQIIEHYHREKQQRRFWSAPETAKVITKHFANYILFALNVGNG